VENCVSSRPAPADRQQDTPGQPACYHCGEPVPAAGSDRSATAFGAQVLGQWRPMCCAGCAAVAEAIVAGGLEDYYRRRTALPGVPASSDADGAGRAGDQAQALGAMQPGRDDRVPAALRAARAQSGALDDPLWQAGRVADRGEEREAVLAVSPMDCAACAWLIEQRLATLSGVREARVIYATRRLRVRWADREVHLSAIVSAVAALGYRAVPFDDASVQIERRRAHRAALWRLFVATLAMMQVMMYALPAYVAGPDELGHADAAMMRWAGFVLTLPVMIWSASPFFAGAWRDLRVRRLGMDVPVALGLLVAFAASTRALVAGGDVYFDSITMVVFLLLTARYLELRARERAARWVDGLSAGSAEIAQRLADWPHSRATEAVAAERLQAGDPVLIGRGAAVPADAELIEGEAEFDESLVTGESHPVQRRLGEPLLGGAINRGGVVVARVSRSLAEGTRAGIERLVERGLAERPWVQRLADRHASLFTVIVLAAALLTALLWWPRDPGQALACAVAVLVVTCPCALALATPLALLAANARLAAAGVLATSASALERLARIDRVVFDKTGTLTDGQLELEAVQPLADQSRARVLAIAAALEAGAAHPVARALVDAHAREAGSGSLAAGLKAEDLLEQGGGVSGCLTDADGAKARWRLGNPAWIGPPPGPLEAAALAVALAQPDRLVLVLACDAHWQALFVLRDHLREGTRSMLSALDRLGVGRALFSGDRQATVGALGLALGIAPARGDLDPAGKQAALGALQRAGEAVAMVGDGVNDAPVLASADCAISLAGATPLARLHADIILLRDDLGGIPLAIEQARRARAVIRQNLAGSLIYNLAALPVAALGWVPPWLAGAGMAASSLAVVLNSMRLAPSGR
jgi:Cu2+-exporting ATPase